MLILSMLAGCGEEAEQAPAEEPVQQEEETGVSPQPAQEEGEKSFAEVDPDGVTYEMVQNYRQSLQEYAGHIDDLYHDDKIPQSDEVESALRSLNTLLREIEDLTEADLPDEESRRAEIERMDEISDGLNEVLDRLNFEYQDAPDEDMRNTVKHHYQAMIDMYNDLADYFNQDGVVMTAEQISAMRESAAQISRFDDVYIDGITSNSELERLNDEILEVIDWLEAVGKTTE